MAALPQGKGWKQGNEEDISKISNCYCPSCGGGNGVTVMLPTKVPLFRELIIMSLSCPDCNFRNSEVNFGGEIQQRGERIVWKVTSAEDLNRQVIKSDSATLFIPSLDFEIPPSTQRGSISTLEGVLRRAADNLDQLQAERLRLGDVDNFHRCHNVIAKLRVLAGDEIEDDYERFPFDVILDDPAGNSFVENPHAPKADPYITVTKYDRTPMQDMALGLQPSKEAVDAGTIDDLNPAHKNPVNAPSLVMDDNMKQEALKFPTPCPSCRTDAETNMCMIDIPHFKEVVIMSLSCEHCGYRSNEIKGGGAIPKFGTIITLRIRCAEDLAREVLKSDTAGVEIPELELKLDEGGVDGLYTTAEGLLDKIHERLKESNPFGSGDAATKQHRTNDGGTFSEPNPIHVRYMEFLAKLQNMAKGHIFPFTLIISDPLSNSFVGPIPKDAIALSRRAEKEGTKDCYAQYVDSGMAIEEYERSTEQNEMLGLNDMKTENYGAEATQNYGTDSLQELPDRLRRLDVRGPDHPHEAGKAPVEGDETVMGKGSESFAVPAMAQRGKAIDEKAPATNASTEAS